MRREAFTLVEILVGILIFSLIIIGGFQAFSSVTVGKVRLIHQANTQKQIIYFSQRLFEEVKNGGLVDYEEYFNRKMVGISFGSGHYDTPTGFGNFGKGGVVGSTSYGGGFYYCVSGNNISDVVSGTGCVSSLNMNENGQSDQDYEGFFQRYGQYSFQFIDYNSNYDADGGDENGDGEIVGDDDDEYLGRGPSVFTGGTDVKELYLMSGDKTKRTLFRWNVMRDPNAPPSASCSIGTDNVLSGSGCLGTIEFLKLDGKDWGMDHVIGTDDEGEYDGVVETWLVDSDFSGENERVAGSNASDYYVSLFPSSISVTDFKVFVYPHKDLELSWKESGSDLNVTPYVRLQLSVVPSWELRRRLKGDPEEVTFSTTISLTDIFSK